MERTGIEPVTSGLQSRAAGSDERRRSGEIPLNHGGLRGYSYVQARIALFGGQRTFRR